MPIIKGASSALDLFEDIGGLGCPDERLGTLVVFVDIFTDGCGEVFSIAKNSAPQSVLSEVPKEAFHHIQPGTTGRREVNVEPGMTSQPSLHFGMFVRGIVVDD